MGLRHVLEHYLRGLRVGQTSLRSLPDLDGDLRDMQFESAWRMCEWDPALSVGATHPPMHGTPRFHAYNHVQECALVVYLAGAGRHDRTFLFIYFLIFGLFLKTQPLYHRELF